MSSLDIPGHEFQYTVSCHWYNSSVRSIMHDQIFNLQNGDRVDAKTARSSFLENSTPSPPTNNPWNKYGMFIFSSAV